MGNKSLYFVDLGRAQLEQQTFPVLKPAVRALPPTEINQSETLKKREAGLWQ